MSALSFISFRDAINQCNGKSNGTNQSIGAAPKASYELKMKRRSHVDFALGPPERSFFWEALLYGAVEKDEARDFLAWSWGYC